MLIPKQYRQMLKSIGHPHMFWIRTYDWACGERYKFKDGSMAYLVDGEIVTIRKGTRTLWRKDHCIW